MDPLQVAMTGVRMGERVLQIGCDDRSLLPGLATKVGLSGAIALAAGDEAAAERGRRAARKAGALLELKVGSPGSLAFPDAAFDMVVVDDTAGAFHALGNDIRLAALREARRVLRDGGRVEVVEHTGGSGFFGRSWSSSRQLGTDAEPATLALLRQAGFAPVRLLAEKDGFRFVEGLKSTPASLNV